MSLEFSYTTSFVCACREVNHTLFFGTIQKKKNEHCLSLSRAIAKINNKSETQSCLLLKKWRFWDAGRCLTSPKTDNFRMRANIFFSEPLCLASKVLNVNFLLNDTFKWSVKSKLPFPTPKVFRLNKLPVRPVFTNVSIWYN